MMCVPISRAVQIKAQAHNVQTSFRLEAEIESTDWLRHGTFSEHKSNKMREETERDGCQTQTEGAKEKPNCSERKDSHIRAAVAEAAYLPSRGDEFASGEEQQLQRQ